MKFGQKKSRPQRAGHIYNYYLVAAFFAVAGVAWIANLGVVPLFFSSFFLALPAFFFFLNLLFSVTHVLETIGILLYNCLDQLRTNTNKYFLFLINKYKPYFLHTNGFCVKGIFVFCLFLPFFSLKPAISGENSDLIIAKGQIMTLELKELTKFNISNKEVVKYKFDEKSKILHLQGQSLGVSDLLIWQKNEKKPLKRQIFVISKNQEKNNLLISEQLQSMGLEVKNGVNAIHVFGKIQNTNDYEAFKKLQAKNKELINDSIELTSELKKSILAKVYKTLIKSYYESTQCSIELSDVTCTYPANHPIAADLMDHLKSKYNVQFIKVDAQNFRKNYHFKLKIIQIEQLEGLELRFGLDQLNTTLGDLINLPLKSILDKNRVLINEQQINISTLAQPTGLIRAKSPAEFSIGSDIPFETKDREGVTTTSWQFAGLKINLELENIGNEIMLNYHTTLTKPDLNEVSSISGNKEKSSVVIALNTPVKLFEISLQTQSIDESRFPIISQLPIVGEIFKSKGKRNNYKMITGILEVE